MFMAGVNFLPSLSFLPFPLFSLPLFFSSLLLRREARKYGEHCYLPSWVYDGLIRNVSIFLYFC